MKRQRQSQILKSIKSKLNKMITILRYYAPGWFVTQQKLTAIVKNK